MDLNDRFEITIVGASDLPLVTGVPPSTFCEIEVGNDKKRTPVINEERNPKYDSEPLIFYDLVMNDIDAVLIYVKHMGSDGSEFPGDSWIYPWVYLWIYEYIQGHIHGYIIPMVYPRTYP